ncbi:MAG TPA: SGNH/GDSL hydrolase family protein [Actinopolymorphaceae bacterium]|mgnify:CR=1 FL=1|jgi:lysophospholipase L1-like esterase
MTVKVPRGGRVLFIGDSITDAGRDKSRENHLGSGYAMMAAAWFTAANPEHHATFLNRGVSGDRVRDLVRRWESDCLELGPDVVSILIGINDTWRRYSDGEATPIDEFERDYRRMLVSVREELDADLVLVEPFLIPVNEDQQAWRADLGPKVDVIRRLAREFGASCLAVESDFIRPGVPTSVWTDDGVHLTQAGHALLAQRWLSVVLPG